MSRRDHFLTLRNARPHVLPSLLSADFRNLEREVQSLERGGAACLHLDVMDGSFVPNLTFGLPILAALRKLTALPLDVHLMIVEPQRYVEAFAAAGADCLTIHVEAVADPRPVLQQIRDLGVASGIALNPATDVRTLDGCLDLCDLVLVMSVPAGFGGQEFDEIALEKLRHVRERVNSDTMLEVDGGVNGSTIRSCVMAGAELLVAGSAVFQHENYGTAMQALRRVATGAS